MLKLKIDIKQQVKFVVIAIILFGLSSCQSLNNSTAITSSTKFTPAILDSKLQHLHKWTIKGVIGIRYNGKADSANYIYSQDGDDFSIKLYGPLSIGSVEIKSNTNKVIFIDSKGNKTQANNVKNLMVQQLGWYVPVEGLKYWIKGVAIATQQANKQVDSHNLTQTLVEQGWKISYNGYKIFANKYPLPTKIKMVRDDLYLKIIIKSWAI